MDWVKIDDSGKFSCQPSIARSRGHGAAINRVARIQELNFEPFYVDMERRGIELHDLPPAEPGPAIGRGDIDAGPVSLLDSIRGEDRFQPIAGFCVAAHGGSESNLLFSKAPIQELSGAQIAGVKEDSTGGPSSSASLRSASRYAR